MGMAVSVHGLWLPQPAQYALDAGIREKIQAVISSHNPFMANAEESLSRLEDTDPANTSFDEWLERQSNTSIHGILSNIGGWGLTLNASEVHRGVIIASPSRELPDYFYQWVRDAALTIRTLINFLDESSLTRIDIKLLIESYIENNYHLQRVPNKLGTFNDPNKSGLGEPKFHPDSTPFDENWGRPQNDGPALRISTINLYLNLLRKHNSNLENSFLKDERFIYHEIIKPDLIYIVNNWNKPSFDLWEEINSVHFFTSLSQLRALQDGIDLANLHDSDLEFYGTLKSAYTKLKLYIDFEAGFRVPSVPYVVETPSLLKEGKRSGLDAAVLLASLHSHNFDINYFDIPFNVNDNQILNTVSGLVSDMKIRYPINHDKAGEKHIGAALGRYPEDIYDGVGTSEGNPWFISTASASEIVYKTIYKLLIEELNIVIDSENKEFFKDFIDFQIHAMNDLITIPYGSATYKSVISNLFDYSDSFLKIIMEHCDLTGNMSEQFNKYHGFMQGARDLTWSYSAVWNAIRWRRKALLQINGSMG